MKVNLKKAAALAAAVSAMTVKFDHTYQTDLYGEAPDEASIAKMNGILINQLNNALALVEVVFTIREQIRLANTQSGVSELLTARAKNERQLAILNTLPVHGPIDLKRISTMHGIAQAGLVGDQKYGGPKAPIVQLETASLVNPILSAAKRTKRKIDEELQSLNFRTEIELSADVVKVLTDLDLI